MRLSILQFGATGALAREVLAAAPQEVSIRALSRTEVDLSDPGSVMRAIDEAGQVDLVLNAAAYTAVDRAENEPDLAYAVNARAPMAMAKACQARGLPLVHISTDMVFSGAKDGAYVEDDLVGPLHVYGASKLAGEDAVLAYSERGLVVRVSWLFSRFGQNFVQAILKAAQSQAELRIVSDQRARPTSSADVAAFLLSQAQTLAALPAGDPRWGLVHCANQGCASRLDMAREVFTLAGGTTQAPVLHPVATHEFPTPARRALNAELDCSRLEREFGTVLRPWRDALAEMMRGAPPTEGT